MSKQKSRVSLGKVSVGSDTLNTVKVLMVYHGDTTPLQLIIRLLAKEVAEISQRQGRG